MAQNQPFNYKTAAKYNTTSINTYGALILPFDTQQTNKATEVETNPKETTKQVGKFKTAFKNAGSNFSASIKSNQNVKVLTEYMQDKRNMRKLGVASETIMSKFSGIAVAQAIIDGKVSSREAIDYLFMGFAPAIGIQASLMGYSGLNQIKDALLNGTINVGEFISGFRKVLKGGTDLKDMLTRKNTETSGNIIEFDLTISHSENYQSETPDRRVQSGQSLNEYIHNLPETFEVQCALQEGKRYSKAEFRAILQYLRDRKETVQLILGDEIFDSLMLEGFNPNHDCTKSGMDYTLSFKKIIRSDITIDTEVEIQKMPEALEKDVLSSDSVTGSITGGGSSNLKNVLPKIATDLDFDKIGNDLMSAYQNAIVQYYNGEKTMVKAAVDKLMINDLEREKYEQLGGTR